MCKNCSKFAAKLRKTRNCENIQILKYYDS